MLRFKRKNGENYPDWRKVSFGDIIEEFSEKTKTENEQVLLSSAIEGVFLNSELFGHQRGSSNIGYKIIKKGALILSTQNLHLGNANVNMRFEEGMVSPAYKTYNIIGCNIKFMDIWIKREETKKFFYNATTVGASACRRNVEWDLLYSSHIYLPCEKEQQKIAKFLSKVDEKIVNQEAVISDYEEMKKGLMQKIFNQEVRFKADDGSEYPEWEEKTFMEVFNIIQNNTFSRDCLNKDEGEVLNIHYGDVLIKYGSITDICKEKIPFINTDILLNKFTKESYLCDGDIVIADTAEDMTVGKATEICGATEKKVLSGLHTIPCRPKMIFAPRYLGYYINSEEYHNQLMPLIQGIKVSSISKGNISKTIITYSCLEEQQKIADCLSAMDRKIEAEKKILEDWKELKKALLQQMFV